MLCSFPQDTWWEVSKVGFTLAHILGCFLLWLGKCDRERLPKVAAGAKSCLFWSRMVRERRQGKSGLLFPTLIWPRTREVVQLTVTEELLSSAIWCRNDPPLQIHQKLGLYLSSEWPSLTDISKTGPHYGHRCFLIQSNRQSKLTFTCSFFKSISWIILSDLSRLWPG